MIRPKDIFFFKDVIVPLIGDNCFVYKTDDKEVILQDFLVDKLTEGRVNDAELLLRMKNSGYFGMNLVRKHCFDNDESEFMVEYSSIIENYKKDIHLNETIKSFLQAYEFDVIVTTSIFRFIEDEMPLYNSLCFPSVDGNQKDIRANEKIVYHIFGLMSAGHRWVSEENELLHFVHELHGDGATDLKNYLKADAKKKALFVIGSSLPDWLFRFFLYPMTDFSKNKVGYFLSSTDEIEDSFRSFLDDIHYKYDINQKFENILKEATILRSSFINSNNDLDRISHGKEYDVFISYASENREMAIRIEEILIKNYGLKIWLDKSQIKDGNYEKRIVSGITNSAYFMPIVTKEYILKHKIVFDEYDTVEDILNDDKLEFVQMETLIAEKHCRELQRIAYSLPIVVKSPIGRGKELDFNTIENHYAGKGILPLNLFSKQQMYYFSDAFNGTKDWSCYKTIEK